MGRSRGGFSTKVHIAVDALGNPVRLILSEGQQADVTHAPTLIEGLEFEMAIADKAYDSDEFLKIIAEDHQAQAVIPPKKNRKEQRDFDRHLYKVRNLVERFINLAKHCRRAATRYEKTARNFLAFWTFASITVLLR